MSDQNQILKQAKEALDKAVDEARRNRSFLNNVGPAIVDMLRPILNKIADDSKDIKEDLVNAIKQIKVEVNPEFKLPEISIPEIKLPDIKSPAIPEIKIPPIRIPEIKIPLIKVPRPEVIVNVPEIKIPKIIVPETKVEIPEDLSVSLKDVDHKHPLPVILTDLAGNPYTAAGGGGGGVRVVSNKRHSADLNISPINISAAGDNSIITGVSSQSIKIYKIFFVCNTAVNIILKNGASINMTGTMNFTANGSMTLDYDDEPWFHLTNGNDFIMNLSSAQQVSGLVHYIQNNE